ncbi:hypothetical protein [Streptomyces sp. NPDC093094]|uniref:hypothetical protein n=1 Tax=Streptomyces sp. NPDC093094 TaxID=3366026 RepID=UPI00380C38D9
MEPDVVAAVVRVMSELARGATATVGTEIGQTVSDLVRRRLGGDPSGQQALAAVTARPDDPEARAQLTDAVAGAVAQHPEFAAQLAQALAGPPPPDAPRSYTHSVVIDGSASVRRSTISLGPVTFNNTPSGRAAFAVLVAAVVALVVLLVRGGTQMFDDDGSPGAGPGTSGAPFGQGDGQAGNGSGAETGGGNGSASAPLPDEQALAAVLPDTTSLPSGWTEVTPPHTQVSGQEDGSSFAGRVAYEGRYSMPTEFIAYAYPGETEARAAFATYRRKAQDMQSVAMPEIGDESAAYARPSTTYTMVRTGTVITIVAGSDNESRSYDAGDLESVTRLFSDRARAAQAD